MYPITDNRVPFTIPLIDPGVQPKKHKLYPMSSLKLEELQKQITPARKRQNCAQQLTLWCTNFIC